MGLIAWRVVLALCIALDAVCIVSTAVYGRWVWCALFALLLVHAIWLFRIERRR